MPLPSRLYADAVVLALSGRLDHDSCDQFRADLQPHVERSARDGNGIVIDLAGLEYVSSAGLRCFMLAAKQANAQRGRIVVAALQPVVAEIFEISRFNLVLKTYPTVRDALATLSADAAAAYDKAA